MNDVLASECSTGCESGWTLYLEHSFLPPYSPHRANEFFEANNVFTEEKREKEEEEEEEDSSMVSDASSGPPHFHEDENYHNDDNGCCYNAPINPTLPKNSGKKQKSKENRHRKFQEQPSNFLDDTASSPIFNFPNNNYTLTNNQATMENILDFSQGYSANHFEERSAFHGHFGYLQSSVSGNQVQQNQLKVV